MTASRLRTDAKSDVCNDIFGTKVFFRGSYEPNPVSGRDHVRAVSEQQTKFCKFSTTDSQNPWSKVSTVVLIGFSAIHDTLCETLPWRGLSQFEYAADLEITNIFIRTATPEI